MIALSSFRPILVVPPEKQHPGHKTVPKPIMVVPPERQTDAGRQLPPSAFESPAIPKPIFVAPRSSPTSGSAQPAKIPSPVFVVPNSHGKKLDPHGIHAALQRKVDAFFKTAHTPVAAPMNPERFPSTDVTPKFELGIDRTAFFINGELWVRQTAISPNAKPTWFDLGRMAFA